MIAPCSTQVFYFATKAAAKRELRHGGAHTEVCGRRGASPLSRATDNSARAATRSRSAGRCGAVWQVCHDLHASRILKGSMRTRGGYVFDTDVHRALQGFEPVDLPLGLAISPYSADALRINVAAKDLRKPPDTHAGRSHARRPASTDSSPPEQKGKPN